MLAWTFGGVGCTGDESPSMALSSPFAPADGDVRLNDRPMHLVDEHTPTPGGAYVYLVRLQIIPVSVPLGHVSRSERLWRYMDEEVADATTAAMLNRNGFRIGRGSHADWPGVAELLEEMTGQALSRNEHVARPGQTTTLLLNAGMPAQRIFTFDQGGRLRGRDYPPGDNVLAITCRLSPDRPTDLLIHAAPAVKVHADRRRIVHTPTGVGFSREPITMSIEPLAFTARVPAGSYLVVGPGAAAIRETSAGHQFLTSLTDGLRRESLLVLVPQVYAIEVEREGA